VIDPDTEAAAGPAPARVGPLDRWFRPVHVPHEAPRELADLARRGSVVFVMRTAGVLNFLYLAWLLRALGLPPLRAALGLAGIVPRLLRVRASQAALEDAIARGQSALVFLGGASGPDPFPLLAALQRRLERPILLVPALLVWARRPQKLKPTLAEILFGTPDAPSRLLNALAFVLNHRRAVLRVGRASDVAAFVRDRPHEPEAVLGRKLRGAVHLHLARDLRAVVGPPLKTAARVRDQVLRDKGLRAALEREARHTGRPLAELEREAAKDVREVASRYSPAFLELARTLLAWFFRRRYDALDVDEEGLARVKRAAAEAPIVLCPSHKSHVDYLVLSFVFHEHGMLPPHIAAGINLSFWPFGTLARRGGAFFIRRSLRGDRIYTATLRAYVKQLLRDRFPQEFYLEGGRSRTGKLLFPKTGLFSMEVDAWLEEAAHDILFVPVAIDYEELMEGRAYARELAGGEKRKEDWRGMVRGVRKAVGHRHGRLAVQFGDPVSLRALAEQRLGAGAHSLTLEEVMPDTAASAAASSPDVRKRELVQALANRVAYGINRAVTMTPRGLLAAALLAHVRRGLLAEEVAGRVELLRSIAAGGGARFTPGFEGAPSDPRQPGPVADALERLAREGFVRVTRAAGETIYEAVEERRPMLDYHRNAVIHRYVAVALVAAALRAGGDDVKERARRLSRLLKLEFMYRAGATFDDVFAENAALLARVGAAEESAGRLRPGPDRATLAFLADLIRPWIEAYRVAAEALLAADRAGAALDRRSLAKAILEHGRAAYAAGRIALRESVSKATADNAAEWLFQQGALEPGESGKLRLAASWREERLPRLVEELDRQLFS
jgi:glycerol-3-phosphate O-acyltransferase